MLSLDNLVDNDFVGRPEPLCGHVKKRGQEESHFIKNLDCKAVLETGLHGVFTVFTLVKAYTLVFVPQEYIETKMLHDTMLKSLESIQSKLISAKSSHDVDTSIAYYENKLLSCSDKYSTVDSIYEASCLMIILDNGRIIDVVSASPRRYIEDMFLRDVKYECAGCKKVTTVKNTEFEGFCPSDLYYRVLPTRIDYFCSDCKDSNDESTLAHLGDHSA
jgi:hypothetical protein